MQRLFLTCVIYRNHPQSTILFLQDGSTSTLRTWCESLTRYASTPVLICPYSSLGRNKFFLKQVSRQSIQIIISIPLAFYSNYNVPQIFTHHTTLPPPYTPPMNSNKSTLLKKKRNPAVERGAKRTLQFLTIAHIWIFDADFVIKAYGRKTRLVIRTWNFV